MKATGIVRRVDDLGRVVIPKEIRRTLAIREAMHWKSIPQTAAFFSASTPSPQRVKRLLLRNGWNRTPER